MRSYGGGGVVANAGTTYYVDAVAGNDEDADHDGLTSEKAKKSLAAAMAIEGLASGDVVVALPGIYETGEMGSSRVEVPDGVTLMSRDGAEMTFIVGRVATTPVKNGCGTDSLRCASVGKGARLVGFTLTGGRARMESSSSFESGGGVLVAKGSRDEIGRVVDCVISNNVAYVGGGGQYGRYERCLVTENLCISYGAGLVGYSNFYVFDSVVARNIGAYELVSGYGEVRNSTIVHEGDNSGLYAQKLSASYYDCVFLMQSFTLPTNSVFHRCAFLATLDWADKIASDPEYCPEGDCLFLTESEMALDEEYRPTAGSRLIDAGRADYLATGTETDLYGTPRVQNGAIDIGAVEYDWRSAFAKALDPSGGVSVRALDAGVVTNAAWGLDFLPLSDQVSLEVDWNHSVSLASSHAFTAKVAGTGTLSVYYDGSDQPARVLTASDGEVAVSRESETDMDVRIVYARGDGDTSGATVSSFRDAKASIAVAHGGLALSGDVTEAGKVVVEAGETRSFQVRRAFDSDEWLCEGVTSNGVFFAFDDYPDGLSFTLDGDDALASLALEAVYAPTPITTWYVDPTNGVDTAYGIHPANARRTLKGAMEIPKLASGHEVVALPGVYDEETMSTSEKIGDVEYDVLNRVVVPEGVTLRSSGGPLQTVIRGAADASSPQWEGCGPESVRSARSSRRTPVSRALR